MEDKKEDKSMKPVENKKLVKIKMMKGRAVTGLSVDANGFALVSATEAARLVKINYAILAEEK